MHRFASLATAAALAMVVAAVAVGVTAQTSLGQSSRATDSCSSNNGYVNCLYFSGTMPAYAGGSCCVAYYASSSWNYWYTNKMWRPIGYWAAVYYYNSAGVVGYVQSSSDNPIVTRGSYGYDSAYCENDSGGSLPNVTCEVYNWNT